eukprot:CAMPEP_0170465598 /NCGR_PEP_ID=MMETSP0123-20130129/9887_1 /TAXON_ID=182087 /ORGANISM="Favella ehrenbergii, Strain Fehren 1" /LENGTH=151 /DNA_ID=CAMNT_0010731545 /DNA_START=1843 /DNA_END=2298 /DNA_ORIENTATION=+
MLYSLLVLLAHVRSEVALIGRVVVVHIWVRIQALLEIDTREEGVLRDDLVEDVEVEGELVDGLDVLEKFAAHGAPDAPIAQKVAQTRGAEGMSAAYNDARNALAHIEFEPAEVAQVQATLLIVRLDLSDDLLTRRLLLFVLPTHFNLLLFF